MLNDPTRPREPDMFTRDWGDAFVPISSVPPLPGVRNYRYEDFSASRNPSKRGKNSSTIRVTFFVVVGRVT